MKTRLLSCMIIQKMYFHSEPPVLVQLPIDQVFRDPPPYVLFNLKVSGNPTPDIQWYHNNKEMFFSDER